MTIPAKGWLVLRRLSSKRPPQHSVERKSGIVGVQTQAFSSDCPDAFEIGQRCRYDGGLGGSDWEIPDEKKIKVFSRQMQQLFAQEEFSSYLTAIKQRSDVTVRKERIENKQ